MIYGRPTAIGTIRYKTGRGGEGSDEEAKNVTRQ
jgi:hypothetical protein